jgi:hypothetical protein
MWEWLGFTACKDIHWCLIQNITYERVLELFRKIRDEIDVTKDHYPEGAELENARESPISLDGGGERIREFHEYY